MIRVLVADDQELVRAGAVATINAQPDMSVVGEVGDGEQAVRAVSRLLPDIVLMDIRMPVCDGIEATNRITELGLATRVIIVTTFDIDEYVFAALRAGSSGFMLKDARADEIASAVRIVHSGDTVLAPSATRRLVKAMLPAIPDPARTRAAATLLTAREREIVQLLAEGLSNAEIGERVFLSPATVKTHVGSVLTKLGVRDRVQIVIWAYQSGLVR